MFMVFQESICNCSQLRTLHITIDYEIGDRELPDEASLLMGFIAALPNLTILQWRHSEFYLGKFLGMSHGATSQGQQSS